MAGERTPAERVTAAWRDAVDLAATIRSLDARPIAIGWATVDLERAEGELTAALGLGSDRLFRSAPRSIVLGGTCRVAPEVLPEGGSLVVLEPDTEGRLAGSLARLGEGPVAAWLVVTGRAGEVAAVRGAGLAVWTEHVGPLGAERLVVDGLDNPPGWHRLLVRRVAGTIRP